MCITANVVNAAARMPVHGPYIRRPITYMSQTDATSANAVKVRPANRRSIAPQSVNNSATERMSTKA